MSDCKVYYNRRAEEELEAAQRASDWRAAETHRALAEQYQKLAEDADGPNQGDAQMAAPGILARDFRIVP